MKLSRLLQALEEHRFTGDPDLDIRGLAYDSRKVGPGYLFVAMRGHTLDGHEYLGDALARGAVALAAETFEGLAGEAALIRVPDSRRALAGLAAAFYGYPYKGLNLVGITGTNGKTTTTYILESILLAAGRKPGVIGTINYRMNGETRSASVTTPESLDLMELLRAMADRGTTDVLMEVSSHALDQGRTGDCSFRTAVFTNLTRDHLDYHETMESYFKAKARLFRELSPTGTAVINLDDPKGPDLAAMTRARVETYGLKEGCRVRAEIIRSDLNGVEVRLVTPAGSRVVRSPLLGLVNVYNMLAAASAAMSLEIALEDIIRGIETLQTVPGRLEQVKNARKLGVVVDYSHTPDALGKALETLRPLTKGRLLTVFGCGGDRDRGKRYDMGLAAGEKSDLVIITSDNPRSEDPMAIIREIEKGVLASGMAVLEGASRDAIYDRGYLIEADRRKAIRKAFQAAEQEDLILIAGKGHEDYQIVGNERRSFDDRQEALLAAAEGGP